VSSTIEKPERSPPIRITKKLAELDLLGFSKWDSGKFDDSEKVFAEQLKLIKETEKEEKRAIHKGAPLFNIGLSLAFQGKMTEAMNYLFQAYVEDTLNANVGEEDEADQGLAYAVLRNHLRARLSIILEINSKVLFAKQKGLWKDADPEHLLEDAAGSLGLKFSDMTSWAKSVPLKFSNKMLLGFPQLWEHRVFIGGSYQNSNSLEVLYRIKDAVRRKDLRYVPIMGLKCM
jgi:hypothetical protein